jgi:hypothetical protein
MGGSSSKEETKTKIKETISTEMSMKIENVNKTLNKSMTDVTTEISNKMVNEFKNKTEAHALAENLMSNVTIMAGKGAKVNITQDAAAQIEMAAVIQMVSDNEIKNDTASKVATELVNKVTQDAAAKAELMEAAKIEERTKQANGFANMVDNLANMAADMVGSLTVGGNNKESKSETDIEKDVRTKIQTEISNTNINENEVINRIKTVVENEFKNLTVDECFGSATSRNAMEKLRLMGEEGSEIVISQVASSSAVAKCMVNRGIGNKALSTVTNDSGFKASNEAAQTAKSDAKLEKITETLIENITTDAINDTLQHGISTVGGIVGGITSLGPMLIIGVIVIGVLGALFFMMKGGGGIFDEMEGGGIDTDSDFNFFNQEGGAIAIHTLQRGIILVAMVGGIDYIAKQFNLK